MNIVNIAAYQFTPLKRDGLLLLRAKLLAKARHCNLKGTILLSPEGINLMLAGTRTGIATYKRFLATFTYFQRLTYKESLSTYQPFTRMLVRIKKEIISLGRAEIQPQQSTALKLAPTQFRQWYREQRDMIVLDTRNDYEVALGSFDQAIDLHLETFRSFADAIDTLPVWMKEKPVVTFCTGGIRCEKGAELMCRKGFKQVYQLEGGILNYFAECGGDYYHGECFVFDQRVALDATLRETATTQCYACRTPLTPIQQMDSEICPYCHHIAAARKPRQCATSR